MSSSLGLFTIGFLKKISLVNIFSCPFLWLLVFILEVIKLLSMKEASMVHVMSDGFKSRDIGLRAQKKILSRMANKNMAKMLIDDTTASLLDNLYKLAKQYSDNKKESEKLIKNIIKMVIKIGVLYRNEQFTPEQLKEGEILRRRLHSAAMAFMSFHEVEFSFDRLFLSKSLGQCRQSVKALVEPHLTVKSMARIDSVFDFFSDPLFLDQIFNKPEYKETMDRMVSDIHKAMDEGGM